jgi:hypothetical protein
MDAETHNISPGEKYKRVFSVGTGVSGRKSKLLQKLSKLAKQPNN